MWLSWMDNRTLFACQTLLTMVYAIAFLGMRRMYRHLPSTGSFALGFFSGFLGCILAILRGSVPAFVSVVVEQFLVFFAFVLFYRGILLFFRSPRTTRFLWTSVVIALLLQTYFSTVDDRIAPRIIIVSVVLFLSRGLIAVELFRQAGQRSILHVFAILMAAYALFGAGRSVATFLHGPAYDLMQTSRFQTPSLVINLFFICIIGIFFLLMLSSELVAIVEAQSLYDHISGALNRRGIDQRLALELVRAERNGYQLAIALMDIDHFKHINDTAGHAAGDAASGRSSKSSPPVFAPTISSGATEATSSSLCFLKPPATMPGGSPNEWNMRCVAFPSLNSTSPLLSASASRLPLHAKPQSPCLPGPIWLSTLPNERAATAPGSFWPPSTERAQRMPITSPHHPPVTNM
jgi:GGDEF domain-containing protein